jgi:hypothetical protein
MLHMRGQVREASVLWYWHEDKPPRGDLHPLTYEKGYSLKVFAYKEILLPPGVTQEAATEVLELNELFHFENNPPAFSNVRQLAQTLLTLRALSTSRKSSCRCC